MATQSRIGWRPYVTQVVNAVDADATAFIAVAGITDLTQAAAISTLVNDLKTYGLWTKMKALYPFVGGSAASHKFNLKDPRDLDAAYRLVFNGGWVHSSNGAKPNGTTGYANTFLIPSSNYPTTWDISMGFYSRTNIAEASNDLGTYQTSTQCLAIQTRWSGAGGSVDTIYSQVYADISPYNIVVPNTNSSGLFTLTRTSTTSLKQFRNTTILGSSTSTMYGSIPSTPISISNIGVGGGAFSTREQAFTFIGNGLSDSDVSNLYTSIQKFQTTLGRHVGTPYVSDPDAIAFLMAAGITDGTQAAAINTLVIRMKADGVWTKMKAVYPFVGGSAASHKFNLKDPRDDNAAFRLVFSGGGTHTSNGYKGNGSNSYADSKFAANILSPGNAHLSFYNRTTTLGSGYVTAIQDNAAWNPNKLVALGVGNINNGGIIGGSFAGGGVISTTVKTTAWTSLSLLSSTATNSYKVYNNGVVQGSSTTNSTNTFSTSNLVIGAHDGALNYVGGYETAFVSFGDGLNDTEASALNTAVQAYQTTLGRQTDVPLVSDTDAQSFLNAANITSFQQASAVNKLVIDLKAAGVWTKMKAIYPFVGGSAASHKFNLKDPRDLDAAYRLVFNGGWTHTGTGALPNGTTGYADTKLNENSVMTLGSEHMSYYSRTNILGLYVDMGVWNASSNYGTQILTRHTYLSSDSFLGYVTDANSSYITNTDSRGFFMTNRPSISQLKLQKNSSISTFSSNVVNKVNDNFWIGARNINSNSYLYSPRETAFASIGDGLTDTEASAFYTAVQTYQTALGRSVNTPVYNNGLVLNLDAGNANSYPGTGTTWFDLSSGKNSTLVNGPIYNSNNGGYLTLDGVNDRVDTTYTPGTFTNQTIIAWINKTNTQYCFILQKNSSPPFGFEIYPTTIYVCYGAFEAYTGYNPTGWHQVAYVYDGTQTGNSNRVKVYVNGILQNLTFGSNPPSSITINDVMQVGWRPWASLYSAVGISTLQMYNTSLSSTEILSNFNSTRGRFGL